jgi:hypothetical protein
LLYIFEEYDLTPMPLDRDDLAKAMKNNANMRSGEFKFDNREELR